MGNATKPRYFSTASKHILVAVEHVLLADGLKKLLDAEFGGVSVVRPTEVLEAVQVASPDVIILEVPLWRLEDLLKRTCVAALKKPTLVYLSDDISPQAAVAAIQTGAIAYVVLKDGLDELLAAARSAAMGQRYVSKMISNIEVNVLLSRPRPKCNLDGLSVRQEQILELFADGLRMKEIAYALHVRPGTVAFHKYRIMSKLKLANGADLIKFGQRYRKTSCDPLRDPGREARATSQPNA